MKTNSDFCDDFKSNTKAQGTIEYLVVLAVVIVVSLIVAGLATGFLGSGSQALAVSQVTGSCIGSGGISVLEGVTDTNGDTVLRLKNATGEGFKVTKISGLSGGVVVDKEFNEVFIPGGGEVSFSLDNMTGACVCGASDTRKICEFEVTLTSQNGLEKKQRISKNVDCVSNTIPSGNVIQPLSFGAVWAINPAVGTGTSHEEVTAVFVDSSGNIYLGGYFYSSSLGFGNGITLTNWGVGGSSDFFVVKYNSSGVAQWAMNSSAGSGDEWDGANSIFVDSSGNVYVAGYFGSTTLGFGNGVNLSNRGVGSYDFFVVKYNSSGVAQWAMNPDSGMGDTYDSGNSVFVDSSGNVYVAGYFDSAELGFGNGVSLTNGSQDMLMDFFVVKYNSSGVAQWAKNPDAGTNDNSDESKSVFVDSSGNVYVTGYFMSDVIDFGNGVNLSKTGWGGYEDFFVVKYNSSGVAQWAVNPEYSTDYEWSTSVFVDSGGNVYLAGFYLSTTNFGNGVILTNNGSEDFFVVKYSSSGVAQWAQGPSSGTGSMSDAARSVFVDSSGNVYVTGNFWSEGLGFGNGVSLANSSSNKTDFFVVKYNSSGVAQWAKNPSIGTGINHDSGNSIFAESGGNVYIGGQFELTSLGFGNSVNLTNRGGTDFFVVKYGYR